MTRTFVVVCEAEADFRTSTDLADRVMLESVYWLEQGHLDSIRNWCDRTPTGTILTWASIARNSDAAGLRIRHGHIDGRPCLPDAAAARRAIQFIQWHFEKSDAIVLIRDTDKDLKRREGLEQARSEIGNGPPIVLGVAKTKRECWVICGFSAKDDSEATRFNQERTRLGFDPCSNSERLAAAAKGDGAKKNAKVVLENLTNGVFDRESECWRITSLEILRTRGTRNGLAAYLDEVSKLLVPLIGT